MPEKNKVEEAFYLISQAADIILFEVGDNELAEEVYKAQAKVGKKFAEIDLGKDPELGKHHKGVG